MKLIISSSENILRFFQSNTSDELLTNTRMPTHTVHYVADCDTDDFISRKLQNGFQCVILKPVEIAYNEKVPARKPL